MPPDGKGVDPRLGLDELVMREMQKRPCNTMEGIGENDPRKEYLSTTSNKAGEQ